MSYQSNDDAASHFGWGLFWLAGGIIGTIVTNGHFIFWGAILVGVIRLIRGIAASL